MNSIFNSIEFSRFFYARSFNEVGKTGKEERKLKKWKHPSTTVMRGKYHRLVLLEILLQQFHRCLKMLLWVASSCLILYATAHVPVCVYDHMFWVPEELMLLVQKGFSSNDWQPTVNVEWLVHQSNVWSFQDYACDKLSEIRAPPRKVPPYLSRWMEDKKTQWGCAHFRLYEDNFCSWPNVHAWKLQYETW